MKTYKTLFFDLDHTLWDFEANSRNTLQHIYKQFDLPSIGVDNFEKFYLVYKAHNERLWERYRNGYIKRDVLKWKRMWLTLLDFKIANEPKAKEMAEVFITMLPQQTQLFPHTIAMLDYCEFKQYDLSLITNGFEDTQWKKLEACNIGHYFTHVITSESSQSVKPHPQIFQYALQVSNVEAQEALMIGDNLEVDIEGAMKVGIDQVYFNPDKLGHKLQPTFEIACLSEMQHIV